MSGARSGAGVDKRDDSLATIAHYRRETGAILSSATFEQDSSGQWWVWCGIEWRPALDPRPECRWCGKHHDGGPEHCATCAEVGRA